MLEDIRYAARMLLRAPGFTIVAVLTLALGIGANTAVFSLVNTALFRTIDAPEPNRLVWLVGTRMGRGSFRNLSYPEFLEHRTQDSSMMDVMTWNRVSMALGSGGEPATVGGNIVSDNYFRVLGSAMQRGRGFTPGENAPGAPAVAVLGDFLWRTRFASDSTIVGTTITINGRPFTVVGVGPRGFRGINLGEPVDLWVPMATAAIIMPTDHEILTVRNGQWLQAVGRLQPRATMAGARARAEVTGRQIASDWPEMKESGASIAPMAGGLDPSNRAQGIPIFTLLMIVPGMVLLIACANAANLLLARAAARRREIGVRLALGATRGRLVRMLMTEGLMLGAAASVVALLCALWFTDIIGRMGEVPTYITDAVTPDGRVLVYTLTLGLLTGLVFGLVPALGATRAAVVPALKEDGIAGTRMSRRRLVRGLVVAQASVSLVLLVTAGLFLRTLDKATKVDVGFDPERGIALQFDLARQGYERPREERFYRDLLDRAKALPGVTAATLAVDLPLSDRGVFTPVLKESDAALTGEDEARALLDASMTSVWPEFFATLGAPLVAGREFSLRDDATAPPVVIINETLARRLWPGESPLGKHLRMFGEGEKLMEVVGVARDAKYHDLTESATSFFFLPELQRPRYVPGMTLLVRTAGEPGGTLATLRSVVREMDRDLPVYGMRTLSEHVRERLDKERGVSALLGAFGALGLLLAALGLYGVMAYAVAQRTREIGIRMALGAARREVVRMVVGEGLRLAGLGIAIGLVLAAGLSQVIRKFLFGVTATDGLTFAVVAVLFTAVAAAASLVPARRASRVDPMVALRSE